MRISRWRAALPSERCNTSWVQAASIERDDWQNPAIWISAWPPSRTPTLYIQTHNTQVIHMSQCVQYYVWKEQVMHFSGNRTVMVMVVVVAFRRGNKGIFCRICGAGQLSWKIAVTLGATITNMKVVTFMIKILALISLLSQMSSIIVQIGKSEAQYVNLKAFLIFSQLCENTHGRPPIFWLPGMSWVVVNIVPNLRGGRASSANTVT